MFNLFLMNFGMFLNAFYVVPKRNWGFLLKRFFVSSRDFVFMIDAIFAQVLQMQQLDQQFANCFLLLLEQYVIINNEFYKIRRVRHMRHR